MRAKLTVKAARKIVNEILRTLLPTTAEQIIKEQPDQYCRNIGLIQQIAWDFSKDSNPNTLVNIFNKAKTLRDAWITLFLNGWSINGWSIPQITVEAEKNVIQKAFKTIIKENAQNPLFVNFKENNAPFNYGDR